MVGNERALESIMDLQEFRMRMIMSQYFGPKSDYESFMPIGIMRPHQDSVVTLRKTDYARVLLKISSKLSLMALGCAWNITFHLRNDKSGGRFRKGGSSYAILSSCSKFALALRLHRQMASIRTDR